jgi:hypothetical protein
MLACILTGGNQTDFSPEGKAFVRIQGKSMSDYVQAALEQTQGIDKVVVLGQHAKLIDNVAEALLQAENKNDYMLLATCDIPFLTSEAVTDFIQQSATGADLYYPIVEKTDQERRFPGIPRTYVSLKEGTFTGGNLFLLRPDKVLPLLDRFERLLELRKSPLSLSYELGMLFVVKLLFLKIAGTLSIDKLEKRVEEMFQIRVKAVISHYPEIANDIDRPEDLRWVSELLSG